MELFVILVATGVLAVVMVGSFLAWAPSEQSREAATRETLAKAKEALIAHVVSRMDRGNGPYRLVPGLLPCPAVSPTVALNPEGSSEPSCGASDVTVLGHLPWRTLGIPIPRDGHGECLWYAVSGRFKAKEEGAEIFNWDTRQGQIRVLKADGSVAVDNVAAVIIAPGPAIDQRRTKAVGAELCAGSYVPADYLEAAHGASNHTMVPNSVPTEPATSIVIDGGVDPATGREIVNDRLITITADEIWSAVMARKNFGVRFLPPVGNTANLAATGLHALTKAAATCLANYARFVDSSDRRLPWAGAREQAANPLTYVAAAEIISSNGLLAGRVPSRHDIWTSGFGEPSGNYFLHDATNPATCPLNAVDGALRTWWVHWRDHLYYAVSPDFSPNAPKPVTDCESLSPNRCLKVNGGPAKYAAIVIFAGRRLGTQLRPQWPNTPPPLEVRQTYQNYLEDYTAGLNNLTNIVAAPTWASPPDPLGTGYSYRSDATATADNDDFAYCIEVRTTSTTVTPCP
jgi:hypothetical protein